MTVHVQPTNALATHLTHRSVLLLLLQNLDTIPFILLLALRTAVFGSAPGVDGVSIGLKVFLGVRHLTTRNIFFHGTKVPRSNCTGKVTSRTIDDVLIV